MSKILLFCISSVFACNLLLKRQCEMFSLSSVCLADLNCIAQQQEKKIQRSQLLGNPINLSEDYFTWNCSWAIINGCEWAVDFNHCMNEHDCALTISVANIISSVEPYKWSLIKSSSLELYSASSSQQERLVVCSNCSKMIGDDYWECISEYCKIKDSVRYKGLSNLVNQSNKNPAQIVILSLKSKGMSSQTCYVDCLTSYFEIDECLSICDENEELSQGMEESFNNMKTLMIGKIQEQSFTKFKGGFWSCSKSCIASTCDKTKDTCYENCLDSCKNSSKNLENSIMEVSGKSFSYIILGILGFTLLTFFISAIKKKNSFPTRDTISEISYRLIDIF